jgi:hypothetical protein
MCPITIKKKHVAVKRVAFGDALVLQMKAHKTMIGQQLET